MTIPLQRSILLSCPRARFETSAIRPDRRKRVGERCALRVHAKSLSSLQLLREAAELVVDMSQPSTQPEVIVRRAPISSVLMSRQRPQVDDPKVSATEHHAGEGYSGHRAVCVPIAPTHCSHAQSERPALSRGARPAPVQGRRVCSRQGERGAGQVGPGGEGAPGRRIIWLISQAELMERMGANKEKPTHIKGGGERRVKDPVTGQMVIVRDADLNTEQRNKKTDKSSAGVAAGLDSRALDPEDSEHPGPSTNKPPNPQGDQDILNPAPHPAAPGNICLQSFPPPVEASDLKPILASLNTVSLVFAGSLGAVLVLVYFGSTWKQFLVRSAVIGTIGVGSVAAVGVYTNRITKDIERVRHNMHKQRGEKFSPPVRRRPRAVLTDKTPESVEWLNAILATAWPLVDPGVRRPL